MGLKYKMVVMDMDYTLLPRSKEVTKRSKEALQKAMDLGVKVVLATGRIYTSARVYAKLIGIHTPIIASNGAIIREEITNNTIYKSILPDEMIKEMVRLCRQEDLYCHLYTMRTVYTEKIANISKSYEKWNTTLKDEEKIDIQVLSDVEEAIQKEKSNILKAVVVDQDSQKIMRIRNEILGTGKVSVSQSLKDNLEVMNYGVTKGNSVKILSEIYGIKREEIIAVGDNENDISMIEYAGLGVAVANAEKCLMERANYITDSCEEDGVAKVIEKFILESAC